MADENININVKSNIGDVSKDAGNAASEFRVMGVSLNGVKAGFASAAVTAKGMFGTIKAGLISTGIGAFLVIIGSLFAYFTKTKKGAEMLERAFAGVGAVVNVITDLFSSFGETVVSAFKNPKQAIKDLWEAIKTNIVNRVEGLIDSFGNLGDIIKAAFSLDWEGVKEGAADFGESMIQTATGVDDFVGKMAKGFNDLSTEIKGNVTAAMDLKRATQGLRQAENDYSKDRAKTMQEIQKARLEALDDSKTAEERLAALQKANDLELATTAAAIELQKERIRIQQQEMDLSENMQEDEDKLVELEVAKINMQTQSFQTQKRLATEMETLKNEIAANEKEAEKERLASEKLDLEAKTKYKLKRIEEETDEAFKIRMAAAQKEIDLAKKTADDIIKSDEAIAKSKQATAKSVGSAIGALGGLMEEGSAAAKAAALTQIAIDTGVGFVQGLNIAQKSAAAAGPAAAFAFPLFYATQVAAVLSAAGQAKKILGAGGGGGGGGGSVSSPAEPATPAPQMMSGAFDLSGGLEPEPTRAYVITDEMTSSQNQLANIRRRATI